MTTLADLDVLARTIYGEARGEPGAGKIAVGWVVLNRLHAEHFGADIQAVCLMPRQFSCWNADDPNRGKLLAVKSENGFFAACIAAAYAVLMGEAPDPTHGSTHYATLDADPYWARGHKPVVTIGGHRFWNDVR